MNEPMINGRRPSAVMLSKRANVYYLEHVRVMQKEHRTVYLTESEDNVGRFINIPDKNTAFILLGKGSSITDAAARNLAQSNVLLGFVGSGGSPLVSIADISFLSPQDEYRPTEYAQKWYSMWVDDHRRLEVAREFMRFRIAWNKRMFPKRGIAIDDQIYSDLEAYTKKATHVSDIMAAEGRYAKAIYACIANQFDVGWVERKHQIKNIKTTADRVNSFLTHGNYLAYGYAAVTLHGLGIPYFLPVLHGKTRRGALVFDVADLFKDWLVIYNAFDCAVKKRSSQELRKTVTDDAFNTRVLDQAFNFVKHIALKYGYQNN